MLGKTNYTIDVQPIFNQKCHSHVFKHEAPEKILLQSHFQEVFAVRFFFGFFLKFHLECGLPTSKWVLLRVSRNLSRHPSAPQKTSCFPVVPSSIPKPGFCCHEMRMPAWGMEHCTELPPGRVWAGHGLP